MSSQIAQAQVYPSCPQTQWEEISTVLWCIVSFGQSRTDRPFVRRVFKLPKHIYQASAEVLMTTAKRLRSQMR